MKISKLYSTSFLLIAIFLAILVIYQGMFYRWIGYESKPEGLLDEFDYAWQGLSLRQSGLPVAWTMYPDPYKEVNGGFNQGTLEGVWIKTGDRRIDVQQFRKNPKPIIAVNELDFGEGVKQLLFVAPFFDRPPLGAMVISLGAPGNAYNHTDVKISDFRKVSLALGVIVSVLIFILVFVLSKNYWLGVLSVVIYNTVPTYVFASRFALAENVAVPFILGHLILLALIHQRFPGKLLAIISLSSGLMGGMAVLTKEPSVGFILGSAFLLIYWKMPRRILFSFALGALLPIMAYLSWGFWVQRELFLDIFLANSIRPFFGSLKFTMILQALRFQNFPIDGWWIWGFISLFIISFYFRKNYLVLIIPALFHLFLIIFIGGSNYPWYYLTLVPFLATYSAIIIWHSLLSPNISILITFFFLAISSSFYWGYTTLHNSGEGYSYKLLFLVFLSFLFIRLYFAKYKISHLLWQLFFIFLIYQVIKWNTYSILYIVDNWGNLPIPGLPKI